MESPSICKLQISLFLRIAANCVGGLGLTLSQAPHSITEASEADTSCFADFIDVHSKSPPCHSECYPLQILLLQLQPLLRQRLQPLPLPGLQLIAESVMFALIGIKQVPDWKCRISAQLEAYNSFQALKWMPMQA